MPARKIVSSNSLRIDDDIGPIGRAVVEKVDKVVETMLKETDDRWQTSTHMR